MSVHLEMQIEELEEEIKSLKEHNQKLLLNEDELKKQFSIQVVSQQRELLAKYTKWQGEYYQRESDMFADIDKFLNG